MQERHVMTKPVFLPRVSEETAIAVFEAVLDRGVMILPTWLDQLGDENPILSAQIVDWVRTYPDREKMKVLMGAAMVYQLLRAQATADKMKMVG